MSPSDGDTQVSNENAPILAQCAGWLLAISIMDSDNPHVIKQEKTLKASIHQHQPMIITFIA